MIHSSTGIGRRRSTAVGDASCLRPPVGFFRAGRAVGLLTAFVLAQAAAFAQLSVDRVYFGVGRPLPVRVAAPGDDASATLEVRLVAPGSGEPLASAIVRAGEVDFAKAFPRLFGEAKPTTLYAQLYAIAPTPSVPGATEPGAPAPTNAAAPRPIGPALVLQPMTNPARAVLDERNPERPAVVYPASRQPEKPAFSGYRVYVDQLVVLDTDAGEIRIALRPDAAPNTAWNFRQLVRDGFYTDIPFHRVVAQGRSGRGFVVQAGDPTGTGDGGPGYEIALEPTTLAHDFGVVSMARDRHPDTAGSQFFIALSRAETARLDGLYCAFGQVVGGAEALRAIAATPVEPGKENRPKKPPMIRSARLVDAPPLGQGPKPVRAPEEERPER
jgi:cyclophilin family peptidyl-prolyl cis-trans isomerase